MHLARLVSSHSDFVDCDTTEHQLGNRLLILDVHLNNVKEGSGADFPRLIGLRRQFPRKEELSCGHPFWMRVQNRKTVVRFNRQCLSSR